VDEEGVRHEILELVTDSPARTAAQLAIPLSIYVRRADLLNIVELEQLALSGAVVLVLPEAA